MATTARRRLASAYAQSQPRRPLTKIIPASLPKNDQGKTLRALDAAIEAAGRLPGTA